MHDKLYGINVQMAKDLAVKDAKAVIKARNAKIAKICRRSWYHESFRFKC
jgi:hypothetical protein